MSYFGPPGAVSQDNTTTTPLGSGATYTGTGEQNLLPHVGVYLITDNSGTLTFQWSNDNVTYYDYPTNSFTVAANTPEFHTAIKLGRYFRVKIVNDAGAQSSLDLTTYFGFNFLPSVAPLNQAINNDADAILNRSVSTGQQPDGDYVNAKATGLAFESTDTLAADATYASEWFNTDGWESLQLFISSDVVSAPLGVKFEYTQNADAATPDVLFTSSYALNEDDLTRGYAIITRPTYLDGFRVKYTNGSTAQSSFRIDGTLRKSQGAFNFNNAGALRTSDFFTDAALGLVNDYFIDTKFGRNPEIDTISDPEDVWSAGSLYTGFPSSVDTVEVLSTSADDTSAGTGARTIRFTGLRTSTSEQYTTEDVTLNGTTGVTTATSWYRINRIECLTYGSGGTNAGMITVRQENTTANVFATIPVGFGQSQVAAYTVPDSRQMLIKKIELYLARSFGAAGSAVISFRSSTANKSGFNAKRIFDLTSSSPIVEMEKGGLTFGPGTDIKVTVDSVSDNDTSITAEFEYILVNADSA